MSLGTETTLRTRATALFAVAFSAALLLLVRWVSVVG